MTSLQAGEIAGSGTPRSAAPGSGPIEHHPHDKRALGLPGKTNEERLVIRKGRRSPGSDGDPHMAETATMRQCGHQSEGEGTI